MIPSGLNSFAKKMKVLIMLLLSLCAGTKACCQPSERASKAGVSITHAIFSHTLDIEVGYAFSKHWSAEGCAWKVFPLKDRLSQEEKLHDNLLGKTAWSPVIPDGDGLRMEVCYWPSEAFSGPFISTGCTYEELGKADGCIGIGYMMKVWKGITLSFSLRTGILEMAAGADRFAGNIDIGINYIF